MTRFLMEAGPFIWPILLLTVVIGFLSLWNIALLAARSDSSTSSRRRSIDSVLFWGGVAAVLGLLGQWMGIQRMTQAIHERGIVSPSAVAIGMSESLWTPIAGMVVLIAAFILWTLLRLCCWTIERKHARA